MDIDYTKRIAIAAAYKGGKVLQSYFGNLSNVRKKSAIDLVSEADTASEKVIIEHIRGIFPEHAILAEESGPDKSAANCQWIIDPLDGTINFIHQLPIFSISIAFARDNHILMGVVFNPVNGELYSAVSGQGASLNNHPIQVSQTKLVSESLLATGFPYNLLSVFDSITARFNRCLKNARGIRRLGSAALDLCAIACGRFDGFWEQNLHPWDTAAAVLIASEAGARVTDFSNDPFTVDKNEILATNGRIHKEMISLLQVEDRA